MHADPLAQPTNTHQKGKADPAQDYRSQDRLLSTYQPRYQTQTQTAQPSRIKLQELLNVRTWRDARSTSVFCTFIASLRRMVRRDIKRTTLTYKFLRILRDSGRLVRCYTQNIDGLEAREGLEMDIERGPGAKSRFTKEERGPTPETNTDGCEVVPLHGDLTGLRCRKCNYETSWDVSDNERVLLSGSMPKCPACTDIANHRQKQGKRVISIGDLRPNVVMYGEEHPNVDMLSAIVTQDLGVSPDLLLIMGTSMRVHGLKKLVQQFAKATHSGPGRKGRVIFVNNTKPADSVWSPYIDYWVEMDCDAWVADVRERRPDLWEGSTVRQECTTKGPGVKERTPDLWEGTTVRQERTTKGPRVRAVPTTTTPEEGNNNDGGCQGKTRPRSGRRKAEVPPHRHDSTEVDVIPGSEARPILIQDSPTKPPRKESSPARTSGLSLSISGASPEIIQGLQGANVDSQQLPTPPSSGNSLVSRSGLNKRRRHDTAEMEVEGRPSKRTRKVQVVIPMKGPTRPWASAELDRPIQPAPARVHTHASATQDSPARTVTFFFKGNRERSASWTTRPSDFNTKSSVVSHPT